MAQTILPPSKNAKVKVVKTGALFYWGTSTDSTQQRKPANKTNTNTDWQEGDYVTATGNVIANTGGTWIEVVVPRWYRKNVFQQWAIVPSIAYYRAEDNSCTWIYEGVEGGKPATTTGGAVGGGTTGGGTNTGGSNGNGGNNGGDTKTDNTLVYVSIAIGALSLLKK
ncbi:hypothetical protein [Runella limosa]|uniref:hypothetical protein n=1 Tax=Runella limosa TaxID=370978 RepID=UPI000412CF2B|nr:hypothetical protein [Runella limosa]